MLFLARLFEEEKSEPELERSVVADAEAARLVAEIRATQRLDRERVRRTATAILASLGERVSNG
jgi:hypothetical protein